MALSSGAHDLRTLIRSSHPLIAIETTKDERVLVLLRSVAARAHAAVPAVRHPGIGQKDEGSSLSKLTATSLALLQHLHTLTVEAIF